MTTYTKDGRCIIKFCHENGVNFRPIKRRLDMGMTLEEALKDHIDYKNREIYTYKGKSLRKFCIEKGLDYRYFVNTYNRQGRKKPIEVLVDEILDNGTYKNMKSPRLRYFYKGKTLHRFCLENNLSYSRIVGYLSRKRVKTVEEIMDKALKEKWYNKVKE